MTSWAYTLTPPSSVGSQEEAERPIEKLAFKDIAIDWTARDVEIPLRLVSGVDAIMQEIRLRLGFYLGTWFLDQRLGIPWIEQIFTTAPDLPHVDALLRRAIGTTPGVREVLNFRSSFDRATRRYYVEEFEARLVDGSTVALVATPLEIA